MGFDASGFGIGVLTGWASAYAVYRYRHIVRSVVDSARAQVVTARNNATRSADSRYINDLIKRCETKHLAGRYIKLSEVLVEPRFLAATQLAAPIDDEAIHDVFEDVPRIHDLPFLHAPYNLPQLSISEIGDGPRALALLGLPGSGRTTALQAMALYSLNRVRFSEPTDVVQRMIEEEEAKLNEKERAKREQERKRIEVQAREKLAQERGVTFETKDKNAKVEVPVFNRLMPLYTHFGFFDFDSLKAGEFDPAEPLVRALQSSVGKITASTIPGNVYNRLDQGQILLLLDGFDELTASAQSDALVWLEGFMHRYDNNFVVVTGPARGYGGLVGLGLTPIFMRPWQDTQVREASEKWARVFPKLGGRRGIGGGQRVDNELKLEAQRNARALLPLEITLKLWATFAEKQTADIEHWYRMVVSKHLPKKMPLETALPLLAPLAVLQLEEGFITRTRLVALGIVDAASAQPASQPIEDALRADLASGTLAAAKTVEEAAKTTVKTMSNPAAQILLKLRRAGLLLHYGGERYRFWNDGVAAYLASLQLVHLSLEQLYERSLQPDWAAAIQCLALHTPLDKIVENRLNAPHDVLHWSLTDLGHWLKYAPRNASWRGLAFRQLTNIMSAPSQYPVVRQRVAAALVTAQDTSVLFILRKAARAADPGIRSLACLAMGALGSPETIQDLKALAQDRESSVRVSAGMALGAVATEEAIETMVGSLSHDEEPVRKAMAEAFASLPDVGHPILYEAVRSPDMLTRRASIAGIRRIRANWAMAAIYRAFLLDTEWYVRSAAEDAFIAQQSGGHKTAFAAYPSPDEIVWLADWARQRGHALPSHENALDLLLQALRDHEPAIRALAAANLGQLGSLSSLGALYQALRDQIEAVRAAGFSGLGNLQLMMGRPLPAPVIT